MVNYSHAIMFGRLAQELRRLFEYSWGYMGTLAAMGLLIGVLGMGIYHACTRDAEFQAMRYFSGVLNTSDSTPPSGLDELPHTPPAIPHLRFEYGKNGRLERLVHISADGRPTAMPGSKVAEQRISYDDAGRVTRKSNFTATGAPTTDSSGVHARVFSYDAQGRLTRTEFQNRAGHAIVPRMPGYAVEEIRYDAQGRPLTIEYLDGTGKPITNSRGERSISFEYDDEHHASTRTNLIGNAPAENTLGIARERRTCTQDGRSVVTSWYDAQERRVHHPESGACAVLTETSRDGSLRRERFCEENGELCHNKTACAERIVRTTPQGLVEWECFNDSDGLPCMNDALGYAERVCEYGADGALTREYFWDAHGNPCSRYEKRYCRSSEGRHVLSLLTDGSTELRRANTGE